ncbi:L-aspartate oxidase [Caloranaerobacter ferrireducens]|uniref:L-aspartate oxidase n=1 Tax=Caloranaerobacter ferrireducens TaxID=1323370 RepID=UPI000AB34027|nr:L-aspartate oxidase [Caloranaerobacter ferrireducens]
MGSKNTADVIIIGSGLAGVYTALNLDSRLNVKILSKGEIFDNNSSLAQGGIAASLEIDDLDAHIKDTLNAGSGVNNIDNLKIMVYEAKENVGKLIEFGVPFDRDSYGRLRTTLEGGHSRARILHAGGDATGKEIMKALYKEVVYRDNIEILDDTMAVELIKKDDKCIGVKIIKNDKLISIFSKAVVIATGGIGALYKNSTNSPLATGDGISMAYRAGCMLDNMEFIQFHPTALYSEGEGKKFLISEAVRGEGAYLRNKFGERFMLKIHPKGELAPRDIVAQSIHNELIKTNSEFVYLDITHKDRDFLIRRFPTIFNKCLEYGLDMSKDLIPVAPVEHYFIGGIKVNDDGMTSLENLYACGECTNTGVHGANRLASNSLLECIVFGRRIANSINNTIENIPLNILDSAYETEIKTEVDEYLFKTIKDRIRQTMDKYVGIVRTTSGLLKAREIIDDIYEMLKNKYRYSKEYIEVLNMAIVSKSIIESCIKRENSLGCHYRIN